MRLTYQGRYQLAQLTDELLTACPGWQEGDNCRAYIARSADGVELDVPDDTDQAAVDAVMAAHDPDRPDRASVQRGKIVAVAQSAAGLKLTDLTAAQIKALMAVLLWRAGGVDDDMRVRPLGEWA